MSAFTYPAKFTYGADGRVLVEVDPRYFRPTEVDLLIGDPTKAWLKLGWRHEIKLDELVADMMREDLKLMARALPQPDLHKGFAYV